MSRLGRLLAAATLIGGLVTWASPAMAARPGNFSFSACWNGSRVVASLSWSDVTVSNYSFGFGQDNGQGLAFLTPVVPPATSGNASTDFNGNVNDTVDLVAGGIYGRGTHHAIKSDSVHRPTGGWATLSSC